MPFKPASLNHLTHLKKTFEDELDDVTPEAYWSLDGVISEGKVNYFLALNHGGKREEAIRELKEFIARSQPNPSLIQ
jgi:hypothetical protein